jgi:Cof subfamily protein (haloacid dehalogenase superfamily)
VTIKLVACDLDGTLVGQGRVFSPRLLRAVQRVQKRGTIVTIATGRGYPSTHRFARQLGVTAPIICYQGAQINTLAGEILHQATLSRAHLPDVIAFCREAGWELAVYCDDEIYQTTQRYDQDYYDRWFGLPIHHVEDLLAALPGDPIKFIAIAPTTELADHLEQEMRKLAGGRFQVVRSHAWFVEGLASDVSKGNGLARLAKYLGVLREQVIALGDSDNDLSMIVWAGLGVAMGNASPAVLTAADVVAPSQSENGAAWAIERYVLRGEK